METSACKCGVTTTQRMLLTLLLILSTLTIVLAQNNIQFRMEEEKAPGYLVGNILQNYTPNRDELRFSLMKQGNNRYETMFEMNEITSDLKTKAVIDREALWEFTNVCEIYLEVAAQTAVNDGFFDVIMVKIIIDDINDNAPVFPTPSIDIHIPESVLTGRGFSIEGARDNDMSLLYSLQQYEIVPETPGRVLPFSISHTKNLDGSSTVKLIVTEKLDRETTDSYKFNVIAKDGGMPPKKGSLAVNVTITDINDNNPAFDKTSYNVTVREDIPIGSTVIQISATDKDIGTNGLVTYKLSHLQKEANLKYFSIDLLTGNMTVKENLALSSMSYFRLIVEAIDQGEAPVTSQAFVEVTVLDTSNGAPEVTLNLLTGSNMSRISEYANVGAVVAHVAVVDRDTGRNGDVTCSIQSDAFSLSKYDNNEFKVTVAKSLNREVAAVHNVSVTCIDKGLPPLSSMSWFLVQVDDENDHAPSFRQQRYFVNLDENNGIGDEIVTVSAFDLDAGANRQIKYFLDERSASYAFVNPDTGRIMANKVFDKESPEGNGFSVTVYAKDEGQPSLTGTATVVVTVNDKNDNRPLFEQPLFRFWMEENVETGTSVAQLVAFDNDQPQNAITHYSMKPNGPAMPFEVLEDGSIVVTRELDREMESQYTFDVMATDAGDSTLFTTASVTFFITDVNDNGPVIELPRVGNNTVHISHITQPNTVVYRVIAFDRDEPNTDNAKLHYSLTTVNATSFFSINRNTGEVILKASLENTNAVGKMFLLRIKVKDGGSGDHSTAATLRVLVVTSNATASAVVEESSKNFLIVIIVASVTVVISAGIIVIICVIRRLDARRRAEKGRQTVMSGNMYSKNTDEVDNIFPLPIESNYSEKKKKEVSFSLENGGLDQQQMNRSLDDTTHDSFLLEVRINLLDLSGVLFDAG